MSAEENKMLVRRLVEQAVGQRNIDIVDEVVAGDFAPIVKRWVRPFQSSFPDFEMQIVELIAEGQRWSLISGALHPFGRLARRAGHGPQVSRRR